MISSRKQQLVIALILVCACTATLGSEPNEAKTELKFEVSSEKQLWRGDRGTIAQGPIKPTHVAELLIRHHQERGRFGYGVPGNWEIKKTSTGQSMSPLQHEFLTKGTAISTSPSKVTGYYSCRLYAVSEGDTKKMVEGLIEFITSKANVRMEELSSNQQELQEKIAEAKKEISEKEPDAKAVETKYKEIKKAAPYTFLSDVESCEKAKETILEMNKKLDALDIEIAGINAKLSAIEEYKSKKDVSVEGLAKLEQILSEQIFELAGALARKKAALNIRKREEEFYNLFRQSDKLNGEVNRLIVGLNTYEERLSKVKAKLANPMPDMLPPKVYQNRITIYPVRVDE